MIRNRMNNQRQMGKGLKGKISVHDSTWLQEHHGGNYRCPTINLSVFLRFDKEQLETLQYYWEEVLWTVEINETSSWSAVKRPLVIRQAQFHLIEMEMNFEIYQGVL